MPHSSQSFNNLIPTQASFLWPILLLKRLKRQKYTRRFAFDPLLLNLHKSQNFKKAERKGEQKWKRVSVLSYNARALVGIALVHLDILSPNEEEAEAAILVADRIHSQMVNPPEVLKCSSLFSSSSEAGATWPVLVGPLTPGLPQRRRLHRQKAASPRPRRISEAEGNGTEIWKRMRREEPEMLIVETAALFLLMPYIFQFCGHVL